MRRNQNPYHKSKPEKKIQKNPHPGERNRTKNTSQTFLRLMELLETEARLEGEAQFSVRSKLGKSKANSIISLLQGCNSLNRLRKIHAYVIINGLQLHPAISNKLLNFCAISVSGCLAYAQLLFNYMENPQTQDWNSIIRGFSQSQSPLQAILYYNKMVSSSLSKPDTFTFSFVLKACEGVKMRKKCREVHGSVIRNGYERDVLVSTNLLRSYAGNDSIETAQKIFENMPGKDLVAWNSMISCFSQVGLHHKVLGIYNRMRNENVDLDGFTLVGLLSSCAHLGALTLGIWIHRFACEKGLVDNIFVANALIDMYAKCGSLDYALSVFRKMKNRDVSTWNSMVVGYGVHGCGDEAISFLKEMLYSGMRPNSITFLGVLCGCSHQGLVKEGVEYYNLMSSKFKLKPGIKHHGCMVDLFGRAGKLDKALDVIKTSYSQNDPVIWRTLLAACKIHKSVEVAEMAIKNLVQLGEAKAGDYVLLATIYGGANDGDGVARMRRVIKRQGIKTTPGLSWIEVGEKVHKFVSDDKSHPDSNEINQKVREVIHEATLLHNVEEDSVIKDVLMCH